MIHYILQVIVFQLVFLLVYDVFLKRETFFNANRFYLLFSAFIAFIIPFIQLDLAKQIVPQEFIIQLPEVVIGQLSEAHQRKDGLNFGAEPVGDSTPFLEIVFWIGLSLSLLVFIKKLGRLYWLHQTHPRRWKGNLLIISLVDSTLAFSFFNRIFLGDNIEKHQAQTIIEHEAVHARHKHTLDLLFFELLRIFMWFNPLVYIYQQKIKTLHEFIADAKAVKKQGKSRYYQGMLHQLFETHTLSFTNSFYKQSLIKKRIVMLQKSKSKQTAILKYGLLIPVVFAMLIYTSTEVKAQETEVVEVIEIQEIDENQLVEKYYKEYKQHFESGEIKQLMQKARLDFDKFTMNIDEFAKMKAMMNVMSEYVSEQPDNKSLMEMAKKLRDNDETYKDYLTRTKTEEYGRNWESRTKDGVLKLYVKDINNKTKEERERLDKKMQFLIDDPFWTSLLISDGKKFQKIVVGDFTGKPKEQKVQNAELVEEIEEVIEVPFSVIENVPYLKECGNLNRNTERKNCTSKIVAEFVNKNFNTDLASQLGLQGRQRINVGFKIDKNGEVTDVFARAPHPELEKEAKRVIDLLPQFVPGTQRGKAVTVPYALPIVFQVATPKKE